MWVNWFLLLLDLVALRSRSVIIHYLTSMLLRFNPGLGYWQRKLDTAARYYSLNSMPCDIFFSDLLSFLLTNILPTNMLQRSTTAVPTLMPKYRVTIKKWFCTGWFIRLICSQPITNKKWHERICAKLLLLLYKTIAISKFFQW